MNSMYDILNKMKLLEGKQAKPDFPDVDNDGDREEPISKAAKEVDESIEEGSTGDYSAKKARAGKDIGKPGKIFAKIARGAAERYGSKERGEKVAGAVLAKLRKEDVDVEEGNDFTKARLDAIRAGKPTFSVGGKTYKVTGDTSDEKVMEREYGQRDDFDKYARPGDTIRTTKGTLTKTATGVRHAQRPMDDEDTDADRDDSAPRKRGRPAGSKRALGAKVTGTSKLHRKGAIKEGDSEIEISGSDKMSDEERHRAIMKKYPGAKRTGKTPGEYTLPDGTKLISGIQGVRKVQEDYDKDEYDEEGEMAKSQLRTIEDAAKELQSVLSDDENLPEWAQKKITLALEYLDTARDYLAANRPDEEIMPERKLSKPEMKKREEYVKSMKKSKGDFEKRYGERGEEVMYATATKMAKKKAEESRDEVEETTTAGSVATAPAEAPKGKKGMVFGKGVYESQISESYDAKLKSVLTEGMSINLSVSEDGQKSLSVSATEDDAVKLAHILKLAGMDTARDYHEVCPTCGSEPCGCEEQIDEELANSPDEQYSDTDTMVNTLSGGLNGPKLQVNPNNMGDNPLAMRNLGKAPSGQINLGQVAENVQTETERRLMDLYRRIDK